MEPEMPRLNVARPQRQQSKAKPAPGGGGEEEKGPHFPLQNVWEELIQTIILQPVSQVKVAGVGDASGQKEDWHRQDWTCPYFILQMQMPMLPMKYGVLMYKVGWISVMR